MDARLKTGEQVRTIRIEKASATVIEPGDYIALDSSGLAIKALATSTKIAWCPNGGANGETEIDVTIGNNFTLLMTGDAVFAESYRGTDCDLVVNSTVQQVDVGSHVTEVLTISPELTAGVVGSASDIEVRIARPIW